MKSRFITLVISGAVVLAACSSADPGTAVVGSGINARWAVGSDGPAINPIDIAKKVAIIALQNGACPSTAPVECGSNGCCPTGATCCEDSCCEVEATSSEDDNGNTSDGTSSSGTGSESSSSGSSDDPPSDDTPPASSCSSDEVDCGGACCECCDPGGGCGSDC